MKKLIVITIFLAVISPVFAQDIPDDKKSNMYYVNVQIERIYPTSQGYLIRYLKSNGEMGSVGIPNEWFTEAQSANSEPDTGAVGVSRLYIPAGRAEIIALPPGGAWPSMSIFYRDGNFSHVRLYVHRNMSHVTWSYVPQGTDLSRFFTNHGESLDIQF
jgi:hypothetical protein